MKRTQTDLRKQVEALDAPITVEFDDLDRRMQNEIREDLANWRARQMAKEAGATVQRFRR